MREQEELKTIKISERLKKQLDNIKIHKRETYNDIIERLLKEDT